ncbi:Aste57867_8835 [Aphanomyces stellatus]|uniref:Aste57867_8835 protein n=1 Tax=Aphanomyces stellatus TaxID=120398 RepID=A0A485KLE1_9STRA|nr:hypothetical protein As57867_008800 [Aphanomyces stellatus]VFT85721.1 Aste57867_8835 [Aphanomyces stellatus]
MLRRKTDYEYAKGLVEAYFTILTQGCGNAACSNAVCRSNPSAPRLDATDAAIQSIALALRAPMAICLKVAPSSSSLPPLEVPETNDDDEDEVSAAPSTPRKRLATAVQLDTTLNVKKMPSKFNKAANSPAKPRTTAAINKDAKA